MRKRNTDHDSTSAQDKLLLTVDEAATRLSLGKRHVYDLIMRCEIKSIKIGRTRRIPAAALVAYVEQRMSDVA